MRRRSLAIALLSVMIAISNMAFSPNSAPAAEPEPPPGPDRFSIIAVEYVAFEWNFFDCIGAIVGLNFSH